MLCGPALACLGFLWEVLVLPAIAAAFAASPAAALPPTTSNKILREKLAIGTDRHCQRVDATELLARWACALAITARDKRRLRTNHFEVSATAIIKGRMQILGGISARSDEGYWWPRTT